eukprot:evm.model.NODE_23255_length_1036_cov_6.259653.1
MTKRFMEDLTDLERNDPLNVSLLVSNDVLEYEISFLNTRNPERLDESEKMIRDAELNMKLNLLVKREGKRKEGREGGREGRLCSR